MLYYYEVKTVDRVLDADTVDLTVDLGFNVSKSIRLRLLFVDAPEVRGEEKEQGLISKAFVEEKLLHGSEIKVQTFKDTVKGSFNRWLGIIWVDNVNLNSILVAEGYAKPYEVHKKLMAKTSLYPK